jgi:hypothetical protein
VSTGTFRISSLLVYANANLTRRKYGSIKGIPRAKRTSLLDHDELGPLSTVNLASPCSASVSWSAHTGSSASQLPAAPPNITTSSRISKQAVHLCPYEAVCRYSRLGLLCGGQGKARIGGASEQAGKPRHHHQGREGNRRSWIGSGSRHCLGSD